MVLTITLNPCIDKSTAVPELQPAAKLRCEALTYEPGGGGINVSKALKRLGTASTAIFPAGGHNGNMLCSLLEEEGIIYKRISTPSETRENWVVLETGTGSQYRFTFPGLEMPVATTEEIIPELGKYKPSFVVISGSLPQGMPATSIAAIAAWANRQGAKTIIDTSGAALQALNNAGAFLLKPNVGELCSLLNIDKLENDEVPVAARQLISQNYASHIAVSMGAAGAWLITASTAYFCTAPLVKVNSTVGAGDSMVAGMVYQLLQNASLPNVIRFGVACGSAATMNKGTELFHREDAARLFAAMK